MFSIASTDRVPSTPVFSQHWGTLRLNDEMGLLSTRQPGMANRAVSAKDGEMEGRNPRCASPFRYHGRLGVTSHQRELLLIDHVIVTHDPGGDSCGPHGPQGRNHPILSFERDRFELS